MYQQPRISEDRRPTQCQTVGQVLELYRAQWLRDCAKSTIETKRGILENFAAAFSDWPVAELRPFDFQKWLYDHPGWISESTIRRAISTCKRCFNWALDCELIDRNPIGRFRSKGKLSGKRTPMTDEHFQALMRFSAPNFRRFLIFLRWTGCRPGEARAMRWEHVRFESRSVVLDEHKTAGATGKPRLIPLVPTTLKMLAWMKRRRQVSVTGLLERLLKNGPVKSAELARFMGHYGVSDRGTRRAREYMGVIRERIGGTGPKGFYQYRLPEDYVFSAEPAEQEHVFVNCEGRPFSKSTLKNWIDRTRRRAGLPREVILYQLRHRFAFEGIRRKVNPKLLSLALGHTSTSMTDRYINEAGLTDDVLNAAMQVCYGEGAFLQEQAQPRPITAADAPPVAELPATVEFLPTRYGNARPRPFVRAGVADAALPSPGADPSDQSVQTILRLLMSKVTSSQKQRTPTRPTSNTEAINPAYEAAYRALLWSAGRNPQLAQAKDREVYAWLQTRPDCPHKIPPTEVSFVRYVTAARHFHGTLKRILPCHKNGNGAAPKPLAT